MDRIPRLIIASVRVSGLVHPGGGLGGVTGRARDCCVVAKGFSLSMSVVCLRVRDLWRSNLELQARWVKILRGMILECGGRTASRSPDSLPE